MDVGERRSKTGDELLAGLGWSNAPRGSSQETDANAIFKPADGVAQG
jgi:hypothetical protein